MDKRKVEVSIHDTVAGINKEASEAVPYKARERVKQRLDKTKTNITYFVTLATHRRMKQYALDNNTSLQQMLDEAVDMLFAAHGEAAIEKTGAKE